MIEPGDDAERIYTPDEEARLTQNLVSCTADVHRGTLRHDAFTLGGLCDLHRRIFSDVRGHAGRHRRSDYGSERLLFGPNRSPDRSEVETKLKDIFDKLKRGIHSFDENLTHPKYEESALHLAAWAHAELIRIHPFEDGNGRTCRLFANAILVRLGLLPVALEACKQEYYECLNHYIKTKEIQPFTDLMIRLSSRECPRIHR